jgi:uncharacterized protein YecE (DUF72 family)
VRTRRRAICSTSPRLDAFLALLPPPYRVAFEFRHPSWFDDEVFALLHDHQAALCIAEAEGDLAVPVVATADWGYLRLRRPDYGEAELQAWAQRVRQQNWQEAFVFFKHEEASRGPQLAQRFIELAVGAPFKARFTNHSGVKAAFQRAKFRGNMKCRKIAAWTPLLQP